MYSRISRHYGVYLLAVVLSCGCGKSHNDNKGNQSQGRISPYSSNYLSKVLQNGISKENVLENFGPPLDEFQLEPGVVVLTYDSLLSGHEIRSEDDLIGFQVVLRNDALVRWEPVLVAGVSRKRPEYSPQSRASGQTEHMNVADGGINIYLVSESGSDPHRYVDTQAFPKLGYISEIPDVTIKGIKGVQLLPQKQVKGAARLVIELEQRDAQLIQQLTEVHVGRQILIEIAGTPVAAPYIQSRIRTTQLLITIPESINAEEVHKSLLSQKNDKNYTRTDAPAMLFSANNLNTSRDVPREIDVMGLALGTASVTVTSPNAQNNAAAPYRRGEYFRKELSYAVSSTPLWETNEHENG